MEQSLFIYLWYFSFCWIAGYLLTFHPYRRAKSLETEIPGYRVDQDPSFKRQPGKKQGLIYFGLLSFLSINPGIFIFMGAQLIPTRVWVTLGILSIYILHRLYLGKFQYRSKDHYLAFQKTELYANQGPSL